MSNKTKLKKVISKPVMDQLRDEIAVLKDKLDYQKRTIKKLQEENSSLRSKTQTPVKEQ